MSRIHADGSRELIALLFEAQGGLCFHCQLTIDRLPVSARSPNGWSREHIYPKSTSGRGMWHNIVLAHKSCNNVRGLRELSRNQIHRVRMLYSAIGLLAFIDLHGQPRDPLPVARGGFSASGNNWPPRLGGGLQGGTS